MRFYSISLFNPDSGKLYVPPSLSALNTGASWTSSSNGQPTGNWLPNALEIAVEIPVAFEATPAGFGYVQIRGVSLQEVSQATDLNGYNVTILGGMMKGLPLATADVKANQSGLILQGTVYQAYGNWIGTDMTIDLVISAPTGTNDAPINISFNWQRGTQLSQAIQNALAVPFPASDGWKININISQQLVATETQVGPYGTLSQFSSYIKQMSFLKLNPKRTAGGYQGVNIALSGKTITVDDRTVQVQPKQIQFFDLIGQPTWINSGTIQFKCPMRSDISPSDTIKMPQAQVTTNPGAFINTPLLNAKAAFQGNFYVTQIHHFGSLRQPDAESWVTVIDAAALAVSGP